jgi:hypothetical protein
MKIIADLVCIRQDWNPYTNEYRNSAIFAFGGVKVEVPVTPEQIEAIVVELQRQKNAGMTDSIVSTASSSSVQQWGANQSADDSSGNHKLDNALAAELTNEEDEEVFGGDFEQNPDEPVSRAPSLFQGPSDIPSEISTSQERKASSPTISTHHQQDLAQQRNMQKLAMRARAQAMPRKVGKDDMGNPVVYTDRSALIVGSAGRPTVVIRQLESTTLVGDDDGFGQG